MKTIELTVDQVNLIVRLIAGATYRLDIDQGNGEQVKSFIDEKKSILLELNKLVTDAAKSELKEEVLE